MKNDVDELASQQPQTEPVEPVQTSQINVQPIDLADRQNIRNESTDANNDSHGVADPVWSPGDRPTDLAASPDPSTAGSVPTSDTEVSSAPDLLQPQDAENNSQSFVEGPQTAGVVRELPQHQNEAIHSNEHGDTGHVQEVANQMEDDGSAQQRSAGQAGGRDSTWGQRMATLRFVTRCTSGGYQLTACTEPRSGNETRKLSEAH